MDTAVVLPPELWAHVYCLLEDGRLTPTLVASALCHRTRAALAHLCIQGSSLSTASECNVRVLKLCPAVTTVRVDFLRGSVHGTVDKSLRSG